MSLHHFRYLGKRQYPKVIEPDVTKPRPIKSLTLPARMVPPDFSNDNSVNTGTLQPHNNIRENLLDNNHEKLHHITGQANLAVEVGLIVLDSLGLFSFHFRVI